MEKNSAQNVDPNLLEASGKLPSEDRKMFTESVQAIINQWEITKPVDVMVANRMVATWMKMRFIEENIKKYGMFFEDRDEDTGSIIRIRMNEMAYYLKQLEADFRSYYRVLQTNCGKNKNVKSENFVEWLEADTNDKNEKNNGQ